MSELRRLFIHEHTSPRRPPAVPEIQLCLGTDVFELWRAIAEWQPEREPDVPYWAFAWVGGQALARYVLDHREEFAAKTVLDLGSGSGLVAIAAALAGASRVLAADVDTFAQEAIAENARSNLVRVCVIRDDLLFAPPPPVDVILAGDVLYTRNLAERVLPWLQAACGSRVLIGDPGRPYFQGKSMTRLVEYSIASEAHLEGTERKMTGVYTVAAGYAP